jgi:hypothetical protein
VWPACVQNSADSPRCLEMRAGVHSHGVHGDRRANSWAVEWNIVTDCLHSTGSIAKFQSKATTMVTSNSDHAFFGCGAVFSAGVRMPKSKTDPRYGLAAALLFMLTPGCSYEALGPIDQHFSTYAARLPENNKIFVCSAYGCRTQTAFKFTSADLSKLRSLMAEPKHGAGPAEERVRIARTLAWMEKRVDDVVGTSADRPGDDLQGAGDPTQMDCVDVATNLTSYLLILSGNELIKHHAIASVYVKEDIRKGFSGWTHYAAVIVENQSKQKYAVDGWKLPSGEAPETADDVGAA